MRGSRGRHEFHPQEQQQAKQLVPVNITSGNATGFQFMQDSPGGQQQQTVTGEQKEAALWLITVAGSRLLRKGNYSGRRVRSCRPSWIPSRHRQPPNPKWPVIGAVAGSVRTILKVQAVGGG